MPALLATTILFSLALQTPAGLSAATLTPYTPAQTAQKRILLLRHGRTEMNDYLKRVPHNSNSFVDPLLVDTRLTALGEEQAENAAQAVARVGFDIDLVVSSPLSRALATTERAFAGAERVIVHPTIAERQWHASDVGRELSELRADFPHGRYDWSLLPQAGSWGYAELRDRDGTTLPPPEEPEAAFLFRLERFREWLCKRPEETIAVVTHWGAIHALVGETVRNCGVVTCELRDLQPGRFLLGDD